MNSGVILNMALKVAIPSFDSVSQYYSYFCRFCTTFFTVSVTSQWNILNHAVSQYFLNIFFFWKIQISCFFCQLRKKQNEEDCIRNNKSEHTKFTQKLKDHNRPHWAMVLKAMEDTDEASKESEIFAQ